jgi:hypothetical protein
MRKRLEELNWRTQPHSPNNGVHGGVAEGSNREDVVSSPIPEKAQEKKRAS